MTHERIAATFDEWARDGHAEGMEQEHGDVVRQVIGRMGIQAGMQMLDLGCGNGWATRLLGPSAPGAGAIGVDASPQMIARADELHDWTSRARYEVGTFEALDFPDAKFDKAFSMEALYYAVDLDQALREMLRVLKPGGTADVLLDRFRESPHTEHWAQTVGVEMAWLTEADWRARFEAAGFIGVTTERLLDTRGPGDEASFTPNAHCPDYKTSFELYEAGTLWIHAEKTA